MILILHNCVKNGLCTRKQILQMRVSGVRTERDKTTFKYAAPFSWNNSQKDLNLPEFITLGEFKSGEKDRETNPIGQPFCRSQGKNTHCLTHVDDFVEIDFVVIVLNKSILL